MTDYSIKAGDVVLLPDKDAEEAETVWDVRWSIKERKDEKRHVGTLWFKGVPERGVVEMEFDIEPRFKEKEYTRDVLRTIIDWVFDKKGLYEIKATVSTEDSFKIDALERSGFVFRRGNKEAESYSIVKPRTSWTGLYIPVGIVAGIVLGIVLNSMIAGVAAGVIVGLVFGAIMDARANAERSSVTGEKKSTHRKAVIEMENDSEESED